jgi:hypothetical protein
MPKAEHLRNERRTCHATQYNYDGGTGCNRFRVKTQTKSKLLYLRERRSRTFESEVFHCL